MLAATSFTLRPAPMHTGQQVLLGFAILFVASTLVGSFRKRAILIVGAPTLLGMVVGFLLATSHDYTFARDQGVLERFGIAILEVLWGLAATVWHLLTPF